MEAAEFVDRLDAFREERGMGHVEFSEWLGVHHSIWSRTRLYYTSMGFSFIGRVLLKRPELAALLQDEPTFAGSR
jgi:hypothetical protein